MYAKTLSVLKSCLRVSVGSPKNFFSGNIMTQAIILLPGLIFHVLGWLSTGYYWADSASLPKLVVVLIIGFQLRRVSLTWLANIRARLKKSLLSRFACGGRYLFVAKALTWYDINFILRYKIVIESVRGFKISLPTKNIFWIGIFFLV